MIVLYPLTVRDCPVVAELSRDVIERGMPWRWTSTRLVRMLERSDVRGVVAKFDNAVCGVLLIRHVDEHVHVNLCGVLDDYQRMGIGREMFHWFEPMWRLMDVAMVNLELRASNQDAQFFYEDMGFDVLHEIKSYYPNGEDALWMSWDRTHLIPGDEGVDVFELMNTTAV